MYGLPTKFNGKMKHNLGMQTKCSPNIQIRRRNRGGGRNLGDGMGGLTDDRGVDDKSPLRVILPCSTWWESRIKHRTSVVRSIILGGSSCRVKNNGKGKKRQVSE